MKQSLSAAELAKPRPRLPGRSICKSAPRGLICVKTARRSLDLSNIRYTEGAGTQIDVLDAQSALTEAHGQYVDALRDYSVARARLIRATGADLQWSYGK